MTTARRNPFAALISGIATVVLAFGMVPAAAFANPSDLAPEEIAIRLADAAETPIMTIEVLGEAETAPGETLLTFEDDDVATAFIRETEQRDGLSAKVIADDLEGAMIVTVTSANAASTDALIQAADEIEGVDAQPNFVYTLPNEAVAPKPIGETAEVLAEEGDEPELPANFPNDKFAAKYQYQFLPIGDGTSKSGSNIIEAWDLVQAQSAKSALSHISIGVIDSGINKDHEDLQDNIDYAHTYDANTGSADATDIIGHGSMVTGIIAATSNNGLGIAGVADAVPGTVSVIPVKVFTDSGETTSDILIEALEYLDGLIEDGVIDDLRVINMSLGMYSKSVANPDNAFFRAVSHLTFDHDVLIVGAGGNGDENNQAIMDPIYPSDYEACLGVTALTETGANAYFSDYNQAKDISAPGVDIAGPAEEGSTYELGSGTSHATPIASGVAALMLMVDPTLSPAEVIDIIKSTAVPIPDHSENDWCDLSGSAGALDAGGALLETLKRAEASAPSDDDPNAPAASDDPSASDNPDDSDAYREPSDAVSQNKFSMLSRTGDETNWTGLAVTAAVAALVALFALFQMRRSRSAQVAQSATTSSSSAPSRLKWK